MVNVLYTYFTEMLNSLYIGGPFHPDQTLSFIAPLSDIPMLYIEHLTMYKVHMHAGAIR